MDAMDALFGWAQSTVGSLIPPGDFNGLITDGIIGGVGGMLIFLPQIMLLFFMISLLLGSFFRMSTLPRQWRFGPDDFGFPECKCTWGNIHCGDERHLQHQTTNGKMLIGVILNERPADPMLLGVYKIERRFRSEVRHRSEMIDVLEEDEVEVCAMEVRKDEIGRAHV